MARSKKSNRKLQHILRSPNLLRKILVPLEDSVRQCISVEKESSWFPKLPVLLHLMAGIFFHISQFRSLRELLTVLGENKRKHLLEGSHPKRSTLSDANNSPRRLKILRNVFANLVEQAELFSPNFRRFARLAALDSSLLHCVPSATWATYRKKVNACKAHLLLDLASSIPKRLILSAGRCHDRKFFQQFLEKGWTYIVDRAYNDYKLFDEMIRSEIYVVTRLKTNAAMETVRKRKVKKMDRKRGILADLEILLGAGSDRMENIMRLVSFRADDGKLYQYLTNRFDLSPLTIANLYRARWAIEKLFKWLKRTLRMEQTLGRSEIGMEIHVLLTLIADILLKLLVGVMKGHQHIPVRILRIIRENLFSRCTRHLLSILKS